MHVVRPVDGVCPAASVPVHRVLPNRRDASHRYMTERALRDGTAAHGRLAERDGPDLVVMSVPG